MAARSSCVAALTVAALAAFAITQESLHVNPFRGHLDDHPLLIRAEALELSAGVQARELVDVLLGAFGDQLRAAPDRHRVAVGTRGIEQRDCHPGVPLQIPRLQAWKCSVEVPVFAVGLDTD